ncbi:MAG: endonuclease/exonuclease/phosphatase family protein [Candidatus Lernaella stagnicola]|nr:endonuclease/exonuclease/phosphatase family protein [Candidatus Lernaella stagnicola]
MKNIAFPFILLLLLTITFCFVAACDDDDDDDNNDDNTAADDDDDDDDNNDDNDDDTAPPESLSFATYNAGLAYGYVPLGYYRRDELFDAVPELDVDVVCMEEVWNEEDIVALAAGMAPNFPFLYRHDSVPDFAGVPPEAEPRCGAAIGPLDTCVRDNCDITQNEGLLDCAIENCPIQLLLTGLDCIECLAGNIDEVYDEMYDTCTNPNPPPISYNGSNGLLLLANREMTETEWVQFPFFLTNRVALHGKVETAGGPVHVYCTHLTASISILPYNGDAASYEAEQAMQIEALLEWIGETAGEDPYVLLGDFNNGPGTGGKPNEFPANYTMLTGAGLADPYTTQFPNRCTFCDENPLVDGTPGPAGVIIDHAFFQGFDDYAFTAARVFDEAITLNVEGDMVESRLSDHYGVVVTADPQ